MKKSITKVQIMKALKDEPLLEHRGWFKESGPGISEKDCAVCAVGCVLRAMSFETWARKTGLILNGLGWRAVKSSAHVTHDDYFYIGIHLKNRNYLAALSAYFESDHSRKECIAFVKKNFPKKLTLEITK